MWSQGGAALDCFGFSKSARKPLRGGVGRDGAYAPGSVHLYRLRQGVGLVLQLDGPARERVGDGWGTGEGRGDGADLPDAPLEPPAAVQQLRVLSFLRERQASKREGWWEGGRVVTCGRGYAGTAQR